jgi:DNA-binding transcriptional ArsR family regulator
MDDLLERARACLAQLETAREAALALSEQKAEEAKLIKARQEGFQTAMEMFRGEVVALRAGSSRAEESHPEKPGRRGRRPIRGLILRELSFSGQPMTVAQIARAIDYNPAGAETALARLEKDGQVLRNDGGRWSIAITAATEPNGHAVNGSNGEFQQPADCEQTPE